MEFQSKKQFDIRWRLFDYYSNSDFFTAFVVFAYLSSLYIHPISQRYSTKPNNVPDTFYW